MLEQLNSAIGLLHNIVAASDANDGGSLMNCIEGAREFLESLPTEEDIERQRLFEKYDDERLR